MDCECGCGGNWDRPGVSQFGFWVDNLGIRTASLMFTSTLTLGGFAVGFATIWKSTLLLNAGRIAVGLGT